MPGKISGFTNNQPASSATSAAGQRSAATASPAPGAPSGTGGSGSATDSVQITETASHLVSAEQTLTDVPVINSAKVAEISDALANGTYKASPERIANQLLSFERLLPDEEETAA